MLINFVEVIEESWKIKLQKYLKFEVENDEIKYQENWKSIGRLYSYFFIILNNGTCFNSFPFAWFIQLLLQKVHYLIIPKQ